MSDDRKGAVALVAVGAAGVLTMALHPTGHALLAAGTRFTAVAALGMAVHWLAIASMPVAFLGALALSRRLAAPDRLALSAIIVYGLALTAELIAAAMSGLVAPPLAQTILTGTPAAADAARMLFDYTGRLNQAFARIFTVASSVAIILWSAAILRNHGRARGAAVYGVVAGSLLVLAAGSGSLRLDVHGFGLVVLLQTVWLVAMGVMLWRTPAALAAPGPSSSAAP